MERKQKCLRLRPRLEAACRVLQSYRTVADIGCDHGRLICGLLQQNPTMRGIASDIGALPLRRAEQLANKVGVADRISFRQGDGLSVLAPFEADAVALLGMGGTVMAQVLDACNQKIAGAQLAVFQPMRAAADIRAYLYKNGYAIVSDCVVLDANRLYQVFSAVPTDQAQPQMLPAGWPPDCLDLGYTAYTSGDPLFPLLVKQMLAQHEKRLLTAKDTRGAALLEKKRDDMRTILRLMGEKA